MTEAQASTGPQPAAATVFDSEAPGLTRAYSEALVNAAQHAGNVDEVLDELDAITADVFRANPLLFALLTSPSRGFTEKDQLLVRTLEGRTNPTVFHFLRVLNRHGRIGQLAAVARAARELWNRRQNRRPVTVRSALPLNDAQQEAVRERMARALNATPILQLQVDPSLLGGLVVQVGDDVYDASLRNRLEQLRQRLIEGKTHEIQSRRDHFSYSE
ncbi:MAG: hypothetical protein NVSMB9_16310 [Isosphaeraceae bacterium]